MTGRRCERTAEAIRCRRFEAIVNERYDFFDKRKYKADFLEYYRKQLRKHDQKWGFVYQHFYNFVHGKCTFEEIDVDLCEKFRDYLLKCKQINHPNAYISRNSAAGFYSTFRALLKIAYKEKMLRENLNDFLEKIEWKEVKKEYLTLDEVKKLAATPCKIPVLKQASLFACMTNSSELTDIAVAIFVGMLDTPAVSAGGGGGGSQSDLPWRDKDDDDLQWARRCARAATHLLGKKPRTGLRR